VREDELARPIDRKSPNRLPAKGQGDFVIHDSTPIDGQSQNPFSQGTDEAFSSTGVQATYSADSQKAQVQLSYVLWRPAHSLQTMGR
jgi:hypothetical protein